MSSVVLVSGLVCGLLFLFWLINKEDVPDPTETEKTKPQTAAPTTTISTTINQNFRWCKKDNYLCINNKRIEQEQYAYFSNPEEVTSLVDCKQSCIGESTCIGFAFMASESYAPCFLFDNGVEFYPTQLPDRSCWIKIKEGNVTNCDGILIT